MALAYGFRECGIDDGTGPAADEPTGAAPGQDQGDLLLNYVPSENETTQSTIDEIQESGVLEALVEGVNDTLALPGDVEIFVQEERYRGLPTTPTSARLSCRPSSSS